MKRFTDLIADTLVDIADELPWYIEEKINNSEQRP
jgi:hypothetical protein